MPIYEYECQSCHHHLDKLQKISDAPLATCPECGKDKLRKKVSAAGFRLKGTGWYETDFKHKGKKPPETKTDSKDKSDKKNQPAENKKTPVTSDTTKN